MLSDALSNLCDDVVGSLLHVKACTMCATKESHSAVLVANIHLVHALPNVITSMCTTPSPLIIRCEDACSNAGCKFSSAVSNSFPPCADACCLLV